MQIICIKKLPEATNVYKAYYLLETIKLYASIWLVK